MERAAVPSIVQARLGSKRLPGKVLRELGRLTVLERVVEAARTFSSCVIVATSEAATDDELAAFLAERDIICVRGPEEDVYARFARALEHPAVRGTDWFFRVTADCPLLSAELGLLALAARAPAWDVIYFDDFALPRGLAPELVRTSAWQALADRTMSPAEREHVTLGLYRARAERAVALPTPDALRHPEFRLTLDYAEDYALLRELFQRNPRLTAEDAVQALIANPELAALNQHCHTAVPS